MRRASPVEIRETEDGPHLYGVLIQEGRAARRRREVFAPGAVEWPSDGVGILTRHHGTPEVRAIPERQSDGRITLKARVTDAIREAVNAGRRFMSVEFHSLREGRTEGGIREILRALVPDVALVQSPEYAQTAAEVRAGGRWGGYVPIASRMDCSCAGQGAGAGVIEIEFNADAFARVLREVDAGQRNVSAIARGADAVVADTNTGSLTLRRAAGGALGIEVAALETAAGRQVGELVDAGVEVFARPIIDFEASEFEAEGTVAKVSEAVFSYILVKPTDRTEGLVPLTPGRRREPEDRAALIRHRRLLLV